VQHGNSPFRRLHIPNAGARVPPQGKYAVEVLTPYLLGSSSSSSSSWYLHGIRRIGREPENEWKKGATKHDAHDMMR
jgi:hypothetical protein